MDRNGRIIVEDTAPHLAADVLRVEERPTFAGIAATELHCHLSDDVDWLVESIFSAEQPTVFGAASKACKTTMLADLAVSLVTGTDWLGSFRIPRQRRVLFVTGESTKRAISRRLNRAVQSRDLEWDSLDGLRVEAVQFPQLRDMLHNDAIRQDVERHGIDVVLLDPLYRGLSGVDLFRMAEVGSVIIDFVSACRPASVVISHHITKSAARESGVPALEDLSGAGLAESCGNWWLIGRNTPYQFDGVHDLAVTFGGRDEQSGIKRIVFNEPDWTFDVTSGTDIKEQKQKEREQKRQEDRDRKSREAEANVRHVLANQVQAKPKKWIEDRCGGSRSIVRDAVATLLGNGSLVEQDYIDNQNRTHAGLILRDHVQPEGCSPCSPMLAKN